MNLQEFKQSLDQDVPPANLSLVLESLWQAGKKEWHASHDLLQDEHSANGAWVHAYLHREEGDIPNAKYWYSRAGQTMPDVTLEQEWDDIATALLGE